MSQATDRQVPAAQSVRVPAAAPNAQSEIASVAGAKLQLEFDPNSASVDRVDNSLVFTFDNGGKVTVADFFVTGGAALPNLQLPDGTEVASADILAALNADMDLSTAAGPAAQATPPGGGTSYDDDGGALISGIDRLGSLGTDYWDRTTEVPDDDLGRGFPSLTLGFGEANALLLSASSVNESEDVFSLTFNLSFAAATDVVVTLRIDGTAAHFGDAFNDDVNVPTGAVLSGPAADGSYLLTVTIPAGQSSYTVTFPLNDDHISETDENITFTVVNTIGVSGGIGQSATVTITDDTVPADGDPATAINEMDGPIVGVTLDSADTDGLKEGSGDQVFNFQLTLTDPHTGASYAGYAPHNGTPDGLLSQDMTIVLKLGAGSAVYGEDFSFSQAELNALLAIDGVKSVTLHDDGSITLELSGRVGPDGQPHGETPFNLADVDQLVIKANIINDTLTELDDKTFTLEVDSVKGNESQAGPGASGTIIKDDAEHLNGPTVSLSVTNVNESGANDPAYAPTDDKTGKITIDLSGGRYSNGTTDEDIPMTLTIGKAGDSATYGSGDPAAIDSPVDYYLTGDWTSTGADTYTTTVTLTGTDGLPHDVVLSRTDNADGTATITFTMPKECNTLEIGYASNDDLREAEGEESFTVNLTLDEKGNGLPYGEATLDGKTAAESISGGGGTSESAIITPDNEASFDGPYVAFASGNVGTALEGGVLVYTLQLRDPANPAAVFTSLEETVTVTLKVSFTDTMQAHDLVFYASAGGSVVENPTSVNGLYIKLGDGNFAQVTATGDGFTFEVEFPEGAGQTGSLSFALEINDDRYGGVEPDGGIAGEQQAHDKPTETVKIEIIDVSGNEARINAAPEINANGDTASLNTSSEGTILDDGTSGVHAGGALDGPTIGLSVAGEADNALGVQEMTDDVKTVTVTLTDGGYTADGGKLVEAATVRIEIDLKGASYPDDFEISFPAGVNGSVSTDPSGKVYVTLSLPAGTDPSDISFQVNIKDDDLRETGEGFTIKVVDVEGNEGSVDGTLHTVTIEDDYHEPLVSLGFEASVKESGANDTAWAPQDNLTRYSINLGHDRPGGAGNEKINPSEDVKVTLKIEGQDGTAGTDTIFNAADPNAAGTPQAGEDAYWAQMNTWQLDLDGTTYSNPTYDSASGTLTFAIAGGGTFVITDIEFKADGSVSMTIPKDSLGNSLYDTVSIKVGVGITDDMRQDEAGEKLHATLTVDSAEATLSGSGQGTTVIDRDATAASFDGPYVVFNTAKSEGALEGGALKFQLELRDPADPASLFTGNEEAVKVTLKVACTGTVQPHDFVFYTLSGNTYSQKVVGDINSLKTALNSAKLYVNIGDTDGDGKDNYVEVKMAADGNGFTFTVEVPKDSDGVCNIQLQANDDPLGASGGTKYDLPEEAVKLEIVDVNGNEARIPPASGTVETETGEVGGLKTSTEAIITDDTKDNPATTTDDASLEGVRVGLSLGLVSGKGAAAHGGHTDVFEGSTYKLNIDLFNKAGAAVTNSATNPYAGYVTGNVLPEDLVIVINLSGNSTLGNDFTVGLPASFAGKATLSGPDASGNYTLTLKGGTYDVTSTKVYLEVKVTGDNINEHGNTNDYKDDVDESFTFTIVSVEGNESVISAGKGGTTAHINDVANGSATLSGGGYDKTDKEWDFSIKVAYGNDENNWGTANKDLPGEDVTLRIKVTEGATMQHGEEFKTSAYDLFLSINGLKEGGTDVPNRADYASGDYTPKSNWVIVTQEGSWTGADNDSVVFKLEVPQAYWNDPAHSDGTINFTIDQGDHAGIGQSAGGSFTVEMVDPSNPGAAPDFDMKGEIIIAGGTGTADIPGEKIVLTLEGGNAIYEDAKMGATGSDYTVKFSDGDGHALASGTKAAGDINFTLNLKLGSVVFDTNLTDNYLDNYAGGEGKGDLAVDLGKDLDGNDILYTSLNDTGDSTSLLNLLQNWLDTADNGKQSGVTITNIYMEGGQVKFVFTVKEGYDLSQGVSIPFTALDDSIDDNSESFSLHLSGVSSNTGNETGTLNVGIGKDRGESTTIYDESANSLADTVAARNGFAIAVEASSGYEANVIGGGEQYVRVTTKAYILDDVTNKPTTLTELYEHYCEYYPAQSGIMPSPAELAANQQFTDFINKFYGPTQPITVTYELGDVTAKSGQDYMNSSSHKFNTGDWELKIDDDGSVYYEASGNTGLPIETIKDLSNEGDETLTITLTGSRGNESRPYDAAKDGDGAKDTAIVTIHDIHDGPSVIKLGPAGGMVMEPVDTAHAPQPDGSAHEAAPREVGYIVQLDSAALEDMVIWVNPGKSTADYGKDFTFGEGVFRADGQGAYYRIGADGKETPVTLQELFGSSDIPAYFDQSGTGYFVLVEKGQAAAEFDILILDDNDDKTVDGGVDFDLENIVLTVDAVQGSEACVKDGNWLIPWDATVAYKYAFDGHTGMVDPKTGTFTYTDGEGKTHVLEFGNSTESWLPATWPTAAGVNASESTVSIRDDMQGPMVSIQAENDRIEWSGKTIDEVDLKITMQDYCSEKVDVSITIIDTQTGKAQTFTLSIPEGELGGTYNLKGMIDAYNAEHPGNPVTLPTGDFYVQLSGSKGGEARHDGSPIFMDSDAGNSIELNHFESTAIAEGGIDGATYPQYSFDLSNITDATLADVTFDISFQAGSAGANDMTGDTFGSDGKVSITISQDDLQSLILDGGLDSGHFVVKADGNGNPVVWYVDANGAEVALPNSSATGTLPSATQDNRVEGDEQFYGLITNPHGVDIDDGVSSTKVEDRTYAKVVLFYEDAEGNLVELSSGSHPEGTELTVIAKLVLTDKAGNALDANGDIITDGKGYVDVTSSSDLEFAVNHLDKSAGYSAEKNADFSGDNLFYIEAGKSEGSFTVTIHEDMKTEGDETFGLEVKLTGDAAGSSIADHILAGSTDTVTITDTLNGPVIKWSADSKVAENGSLTVSFASYTPENTSIRQVVEQDVTLTFKLEPQTGSGLVIKDDIAEIKIGNYTFTIDPDTGDATCVGNPPAGINVVNNGNGTYTITTTMPEGSALGSFSIVPRQDTFTETNDKFTLTLTGTEGSEASIAPQHLDKDSGKPISQTITIEDDNNGYKVALAPVDGQESGHAGVEVKFTGGVENRPAESVKVTLTLDDNARDVLEQTGSIKITLPDGTEVEYSIASGTASPAIGSITYDGATGILAMSVPKENMEFSGGSGSLTVLFPVEDNAVTGANESFTIGVSVAGGEITFSNTPTFGSAFEGETAANGTNEGGVTEFSITNTGGDLNAVIGKMAVTVSGAPENVVSKIIIDGVEYKSTDWSTDAKGNIIINGLDVRSDYEVTIVYKGDAALKDDINKAKANVDVSGALTGAGNGVTVNVADETDPASFDGPVFSVGAADGVEGGSVVFTLNAALKTGFTTVEDPDGISITFKLTGSYLGNVTGLSYGGAPLTSNGDGTYTITLPPGTDLAAWLGGANTITASLKGVDSKISVDGTLGLEITNVEQGEALGVGASGSATVTDVTEGELIFSAATSSATEGSTTTVSIKLVNPDNNNASITAEEAITVTVKVTGDALNSSDMTIPSNWVLQSDGSYLFTVTMAKGSNTASFNFSTKTDNVLEGPEGLQFTIVGRETPTLNDNIAVSDDKDTHGFTVNDAAAKVVVTGADVTEGEDVVFNLALRNSNNVALQSVAGTAVLVTIGMPSGMLLNGYTDTYGNVVTWTDLGNDTYTASVALAAGQTGINIIIPTETDGIVGSVALDHITLTDVSVSIGGSIVPVSVVDGADAAVGGAHGVDVAVAEAEYAQLPDGVFNPEDVAGLALVHADGSHAVDASASATGVFILGSGENDSLTGSSHGDVIYGGAGNDTIHGGDGNDLIIGGTGDDLLFGGLGVDTFSWNVDSHDNGIDVIRGFSYNDGDKLCIGIMAENDQVLNLHEVLAADADSLDMYLTAEVNTNDITLQVMSGSMNQTIVLEMGGGHVGTFESYDDFRTAYTEAGEDDQAVMLQQLLTAITC